mmetsp:Transcript_10319/g.15169  ORF Transcript_10319/g.15169 Transcript_10319/m.15169 type:complete len:686 (+) Transcript_10319:37-2094(+)
MIDLTKLYQIPTSSNSDLENDESNTIHGKKTGLRLKQRTSSVDVRKDYSTQTWISLLSFLKAREYFVTVNNFSIWRRHLSWAMPDGGELRNYMTQRYASNMVFMSLLLGAELGVLFNSSRITMDIRLSLQASAHYKLQFWIGISILISVVFTLLSLFTTFTAWGMVSAISDENSHCILRSSIGQYAAQLPQRFIIISIYGFLFTVLLFFFLLLPAFGFWSTLLSLLVVGLFFHVVTVFSAFGRIILHTGAIAPHRIFEESYEDNLLPQSLHSNLIKRARAELTNKTSVVRQYRRKCKPVNRELSQEEMIRYVRQSQPIFKRNRSEENAYTGSFNSYDNTSLDALTPLKGNHKRGDSSHRRGDSKVRFRGDGLFTSDIIKSEEQLTEGKDDGEAPKPGTRPPPILKITSSYEVDEENTGGVDNQLQNDNLSYRDKEKNWFSSIASSIDNTGSYPTPPTPRRKRHVSPSQRGDEEETATLFNNAAMHSEFSRPQTKANLYQSKNKPPPSPSLRNSILKARKNDDFQVRDSDENPYLKEKDYLRTSSQTDSFRDKEKDWFSSIASSTEKTESYPTPPGASHKRTESKTRFGEQAGIPTFTGRGARAESPRYRNEINQSHHQQQQDGTENNANCDLESGTQLSSEHASSVYHSTNLPIQKGPRENDEESRLLLGSDIYDNYSSFHADSD